MKQQNPLADENPTEDAFEFTDEAAKYVRSRFSVSSWSSAQFIWTKLDDFDGGRLKFEQHKFCKDRFESGWLMAGWVTAGDGGGGALRFLRIFGLDKFVDW